MVGVYILNVVWPWHYFPPVQYILVTRIWNSFFKKNLRNIKNYLRRLLNIKRMKMDIYSQEEIMSWWSINNVSHVTIRVFERNQSMEKNN